MKWHAILIVSKNLQIDQQQRQQQQPQSQALGVGYMNPFSHFTQSNAKSPHISQSFMSFRIADVHVNFGLPVPLT